MSKQIDLWVVRAYRNKRIVLESEVWARSRTGALEQLDELIEAAKEKLLREPNRYTAYKYNGSSTARKDARS